MLPVLIYRGLVQYLSDSGVVITSQNDHVLSLWLAQSLILDAFRFATLTRMTSVSFISEIAE